jgi:prolyl-tRNA synthetase
MPVVPGEKTSGERFAGAVATTTIESMMRDGKALQAGTSHYMGTNFAAAFGIRYTGADGREELCHTTSWGMSTRMLGGIVMTHGDDRGLVLPPRLAPHQVVIVPITRGDNPEVTAAAQALAGNLRSAGVRVHVDDRDQLSPGFKFNDWELKGVPVRIELGPRDLAAGTAVLVRRLGDQGKQSVRLATLTQVMPAILEEFQAFLLARATEFRDTHTADADGWAAFESGVAAGWVRVLHCGQAECEDDIKAVTAATPRCVPLDGPPAAGKCVRCGAPAAYGKRVIFARAY